MKVSLIPPALPAFPSPSLSPVSVLSSELLSGLADSGQQAAAEPSTPPRKASSLALLNSTERAAHRRGKYAATMDEEAVSGFRTKIHEIFQDYVSKLFKREYTLAPELLEQAFYSYADSSASLLTDDKFDPADLSVVLLAINQGLPIFVDNPSMKKQINAELLRHTITKDVQIVSFNDLDKEKLSKKDLYDFCHASLNTTQIWGMSMDGKIGIADTGFISDLACVPGGIDASLENAFVLPEFVEKEIKKGTAKLSIQFRSPFGLPEELQFAQDEREDSAIKFLSGSTLTPDFLTCTSQPTPDIKVQQMFQVLKNEIERKYAHSCKKTEKCLLRLVKICISHAAIMDRYDCNVSEINYLYEISKIVSMGEAVDRSEFMYKEFLTKITSVVGLQNILEKPLIIENTDSLNSYMYAIRQEKSKSHYESNKVKIMSNSVFGPLYDVYRSHSKCVMDQNKLCMEFYTYLFESLGGLPFASPNKSKVERALIDKSSKLVTKKLFKVFGEIDAFAAKIGRARDLSNPFMGDSSQDDHLNPPFFNSERSVYGAEASSPGRSRLGSSAGNKFSLATPSSKYARIDDKENASQSFGR